MSMPLSVLLGRDKDNCHVRYGSTLYMSLKNATIYYTIFYFYVGFFWLYINYMIYFLEYKKTSINIENYNLLMVN